MSTLLLASVASAFALRPQLGTTYHVGDLRVTAESFVPTEVRRGFAPVRFRVSNDGFARESLDVSIKTSWSNRMARSEQSFALALEPGTTRTLERLLPIGRSDGRTSFYLTLLSGGDRHTLVLPIAEDSAQFTGRVIGFLGRSKLSDVRLATLRSVLPLDDGMEIRGVFQDPTGGSRRSGSSDQAAALFSLALEEMPTLTAGWSSVDTVFVDVDGEFRRDPRWTRLLEWTRQGGQLVLVGNDLDRRLGAIEGLAGMMSPKLALEPDDMARAIAADLAAEVSVFRAGFGLLARLEVKDGALPFLQESDGPSPEHRPFTGALKILDRALPEAGTLPYSENPESRYYASILDLADRARFRTWAVPFPDETLPIRPVLGILTIFALLVGPGSVIYSRKKKRPGLLLFMVPALSAFTTALIVAFGLLRQGFGTEGFAHSLTIVDQMQDQATAMLRRELVLGRGGQTLQPLPSTTLFVPDRGEEGRTRVVEMDGNQLVLSGDFLPVRERTQHVSISADTTRARLEWTPPDGNTMTVTNALGVDLEGLQVRAPDGAIYGTATGVPLGATATLSRESKATIEKRFQDARDDPIFEAALLPRCGYLAVAAKMGPGVDECSVEMTELHGVHGIVGLMDPDPERWRP
ncbi:hypothetical protein [Planctomycetes bacterium Poly30]|uniref:hypothetical protein n=1 Tax=Saltatorellus ferox TaxID=2528018 RepID=UPI0011A73CC1